MSMSYCTQCGHALAGDEKFCPACGTAVKQATAPALKKTESQSIQPIFSKKILNVKDYFEGKNVNFHNKLNVSCCSRFIQHKNRAPGKSFPVALFYLFI